MITLGVARTALSTSNVPCRQITIRAHEGTDEMSIGLSDVDPATRFGFVSDGEAFTIGPFNDGRGLRPNEVFVVGTVGDRLTWFGENA